MSATVPGVVVGTFGYMAPEQVRGQEVDARTDIFSLGVVLHEMLSGKCAFGRDSAADAISAILKEEAPELEPPVPPALDRVVRRCLNKSPEARFQSAQDLAFALENISPGSSAENQAVTAPAISARRWSKLWIPLLVAAAAVLGAIGGRAIWKAPLPTFRQLTYRRGTINGAAFAPDGQTVVYSATWDNQPSEIYSSTVDFAEARPLGLSGSRLFGVSSKAELAIGLDAQYRFHTTYIGTLARVPLLGGAPRVLLKDVQEAAWAPDGETLAVDHVAGGQSVVEYPIGKPLYRTSGWISNLVFSPKGGVLAFLDHPTLGDNRGGVAIVTLDGKKTTLVGGWDAERGLAWSPNGNELLFAASHAGQPKTIFGVTLSGKLRTVSSMPAGVAVWDVQRDGRVLLEQQTRRSEMIGVGADGKARDLAYLDNPKPTFLSSDGKTLAFTEMGEAAGSHYSVCVRGSDGSPALRLGPGLAMALSPDRQWVLASLFSSPQRIEVLPVAEGQTRILREAGLEYDISGTFLPDGKHVVFTAHEPGQLARVWVQDLDSAAPKPITPPGTVMNGDGLSPDGSHLAATDEAGRVLVYRLDGRLEAVDPQPASGVAAGEQTVRWSSDGRAIYVYRPATLPAKIDRVDVATGKRATVAQFMPADPLGVYSVRAAVISGDGRTAVYGFHRFTSELFLGSGIM